MAVCFGFIVWYLFSGNSRGVLIMGCLLLVQIIFIYIEKRKSRGKE